VCGGERPPVDTSITSLAPKQVTECKVGSTIVDASNEARTASTLHGHLQLQPYQFRCCGQLLVIIGWNPSQQCCILVSVFAKESEARPYLKRHSWWCMILQCVCRQVPDNGKVARSGHTKTMINAQLMYIGQVNDSFSGLRCASNTTLAVVVLLEEVGIGSLGDEGNVHHPHKLRAIWNRRR
jgi:hypothetical protein